MKIIIEDKLKNYMDQKNFTNIIVEAVTRKN